MHMMIGTFDFLKWYEQVFSDLAHLFVKLYAWKILPQFVFFCSNFFWLSLIFLFLSISHFRTFVSCVFALLDSSFWFLCGMKVEALWFILSNMCKIFLYMYMYVFSSHIFSHNLFYLSVIRHRKFWLQPAMAVRKFQQTPHGWCP